MPEDLVVLGSD